MRYKTYYIPNDAQNSVRVLSTRFIWEECCRLVTPGKFGVDTGRIYENRQKSIISRKTPTAIEVCLTRDHPFFNVDLLMQVVMPDPIWLKWHISRAMKQSIEHLRP